MKHNFYPALRDYRNKQTVYIEIGVLEGRTSEWMLENILIHPKSFMIGIDPIVEPLANIIKKYGNKIQILKGYSQDVITFKTKTGRWKNECIDIVYIDGDHSPEAIKRDFMLCWPLLKSNGVLIFDDYLIRDNKTGKSNVKIRDTIESIIKEYSSKLNVIFANRQLGIRKIAI